MERLLGTIAVASLLLAGCGEARSTANDPAPTPSQTSPSTAPSEPSPSATTTTSAPAPAPGTASALGAVIPDGFPLLSGYPEDHEAEPGEGRHGPNRTMEPIVPEACGERVPLPDHTDRLRAGWTNPEDYRERQLVTFADVEGAQAYAVRVLEVFRSCPEETTSEELDQSRHVSVVASDLGDFAGVASTLYRHQGNPMPGLTTWHVVRVGASVLLSVTSNEGGAGPDPERDVAEQRERGARALADVVETMATLSVAGHRSDPPFGPEGFGQVALGMSREALLAVPGVRITGDDGGCEDFEAPGVGGHLQPGLGVAVLLVRADLETPERIHLGSTLAEVRAAYPGGRHDEPWFDAPPYRFETDPDGRVISVMLLDPDQRCGG